MSCIEGSPTSVVGLLAVIGVYSVLAYFVAERTPEIGVRIALEAQRIDVLILVLRKGLILAALGVTLGLGAAAAGARALRGMLFGITPLDPWTFAGVALAFGVVAAAAPWKRVEQWLTCRAGGCPRVRR
jgi:putative ABC transport system permease protein